MAQKGTENEKGQARARPSNVINALRASTSVVTRQINGI
jgi:hypothetical protein